MKKLLCSHLYGFITFNRFVYQVSDEEKGGMRAAMEAATADTKTELFDDNQKLDKAKISKDFTGKIDTYIKSKTAEIKKVETDADKKAAQEKKEKDYADALAALREEYVGEDGNGGKLAELMGQADKKREESAKSFSESMGVKLTVDNRNNVDGAFAKGTELYNHYDEIDSGSNGPGAQMPVILNMLEVVYIEEGKDAALRLAQDMENRSKGVGNNMDTKNMNEVFGAATFKTANDLELTKGASADLQGRMYGLVYLSGRAFGDSETGKQAQAAYLQFLKGEAARIGQIKDANEKSTAAQALTTPTEWAATNPEYKGGLKKYAEVSEKGSKIFELTDKIPNPMERNMMNGILRGIVAGETDPKKQEELINSALAAMGKTVADIGSITSEDIQKFTKDKKLDGYGDGMWKLPNNIDIRFEMQGRLSGLMHVADSTDFEKDEFGNDRSPRVRAAYKSYIAEATAENSPLMKDVLAKAKDLGDLTKAMTDARDNHDLAKFLPLNAQVLQKTTEVLIPFYSGVKKPAKWLADFDAKEKKEGTANPDQKYVDNVLSSIPRGNNPFEYDHLAGILLAVIKGQPKEKWGELVNARLADMEIDPENITEADRGKFMNIVGGRTAYNKGWTVDAKSKGYVSSMIFSADAVGGKDDSEFVTRYRTYVQGQMNKLDGDPEFKDAVDGRDKAGMGLKSRLDTAVAKLNADPNPSNKAEVASIQSQMDQIEASMFKKTQELVMDPAAFKAKEATEKKDANDKVLGENKDFLDKNSKLDAAGAKTALEAIFKAADTSKMDAAKKKAFEAKKTELSGLKGLAGAKTDMDRMRVIAQAQDYVNSLTDPNAAKRYQDVAFNYDLTTRTLVLSKLDIAKKEKNYKDFLESYATSLGLPKGSKDVTDALAEIKKETDPDKRAAVIAEQLTKITASSTNILNNPKTSPFTKADFEIYSAYIAEQQKKNQAPPPRVREGVKPGPGGTGAGSPPGGPGSGPNPGPGSGPKPGPGAGSPPGGPGGKPPESTDKDKKYVSVTGDYVGLVNSVTGALDKPKLA